MRIKNTREDMRTEKYIYIHINKKSLKGEAFFRIKSVMVQNVVWFGVYIILNLFFIWMVLVYIY